MEIRDFIVGALDSITQAMTRATDGLSSHELVWRPGPECNSIGIIFFHMARWEDTFVQGRILGKPQVWESEKWYEKLHMPASESGVGYTLEQVAVFKVPEFKDLSGYENAVRAKTIEYVKSATDSDFSKVLNLPRLGDVSVCTLFRNLVVHMARHTGEISYLRGMQRGMNK